MQKHNIAECVKNMKKSKLDVISVRMYVLGDISIVRMHTTVAHRRVYKSLKPLFTVHTHARVSCYPGKC